MVMENTKVYYVTYTNTETKKKFACKCSTYEEASNMFKRLSQLKPLVKYVRVNSTGVLQKDFIVVEENK